MARGLARELPVTLAAPNGSSQLTGEAFQLLTYSIGQDVVLTETIHQARAIIVPAVWWEYCPALAVTNVPVVLDCYNPFLAETLILNPDHARHQMGAVNRAYLNADFLICASERQRDWLLGALEALGRLNPLTYAHDPSLRRLVDLVPYGLPTEPPRKRRMVARGVWPGLGEADEIVLWGGGLWPWLDPFTAIRAVAELRATHPRLRLIFPGTQHPNPAMAGMITHVASARSLAAELGLLDSHVFFGDWIPYADWPDVLLESDVALTLHGPETLENHLAFRSRVLEYVWAGLPILATRGDTTAQIVEQYNLGRVLSAGDVDGLIQGMRHVLSQPRAAWEKHFEEARAALSWERALQPLLAFCHRPQHAADRATDRSPVEHPLCAGKIEQMRARIAAYEQMPYVRFVQWLRPFQQHLRALFQPRAGQ
jgi:glycosyltransferase involved in cell wall biosynthesis